MRQKRKQAAALTYRDDTHNAPVVSAKGKGLVAEKIIQEAEQYKVPIMEDPSLVEILGELEINRAIPNELYQAVAEVFAFVYNVDQKRKNDN